MIKPITPKEVADLKAEILPSEVLAVFNEEISRYWNGHSATIYQDKLVDLICKRMHCTSEEVFSNGWLDIESVYREAGWAVVYEKRSFNETSQAYFVFKDEQKK